MCVYVVRKPELRIIRGSVSLLYAICELDATGKIAYVKSYVKDEGITMTSITATKARKQLYTLLDDVADSHEPIQIAGKRHSAVLVSEEDWRAIQETLYLTSIPGMRESIVKGLKTPVGKCKTELGW